MGNGRNDKIKDGQGVSKSDAGARPSHRQGGRKLQRKGLVGKSMRVTSASPNATAAPSLGPTAQISISDAESDFQSRPPAPKSNAALELSHLNLAPSTSPAALYTSTTDDDDDMASSHRSSAVDSDSLNSPVSLQPQGTTMAVPRRRAPRGAQLVTTLAVVQTPADLAADEDWDYSETEWWGWVILVTTWLVFVIGMGSCLGVWSWAWDVGETPYAPPELEDDPTLPITGYYPALMVCTAVMAWVWVVVAWVGMKYFRHSKMAADDG